MREIITQSPIQARPDTLNKPERLFPLLAAEALNKISEYQNGKIAKRVDLWNTLGQKIDKFYKQDSQNLDRYTYNDKQINDRYDILENTYRLKREGRIILRDDDKVFQDIVETQVEKFIGSGLFTVKKGLFSSCSQCDNIIAPVEAKVEKCPSCYSLDLISVFKTCLFINLSSENKSYIKNIIKIKPKSARLRFFSSVDNLPSTMQIAKKRAYGLKLTKFGVDDDLLLDPKVSLSMFNLVIKELGIGEIDLMVQGVDSLVHTIPFSCLLDKSSVQYLGVGLIPKYDNQEVNFDNSGFYGSFLPLLMLSKGENLAQKQKISLLAEYAKTSRKFENVIAFLSRSNLPSNIILSKEDNEELRQILNLIDKYDCRTAILGLRAFIYQILSNKYVKLSKKNNATISLDDQKKLKDIFKLIYGK